MNFHFFLRAFVTLWFIFLFFSLRPPRLCERFNFFRQHGLC